MYVIKIQNPSSQFSLIVSLIEMSDENSECGGVFILPVTHVILISRQKY